MVSTLELRQPRSQVSPFYVPATWRGETLRARLKLCLSIGRYHFLNNFICCVKEKRDRTIDLSNMVSTKANF